MNEKQGQKKQRIDALLIQGGFALDLKEARAQIMAGNVIANNQRVDKPAELFSTDTTLRFKRDLRRFVSRSGEKLEGALLDFKIDQKIAGSTILDVGASSGGFTDCCLFYGAAKVIALDVGTCQLDWKLRSNDKVLSVERTHIRDFNSEIFPPVDWVLADISHNSLSRLIPYLVKAAPLQNVHFLVLIKPQFELEKSEVPEGGVVADKILQQKAVKTVVEAFGKYNLAGGKSIDSRVLGKYGNQEIFYYVKS